MSEPRYLDADREVMVVDRVTPLELIALAIPLLVITAAAIYVSVGVDPRVWGHLAPGLAFVAVTIAGLPLLALSQVIQVDFLLDRTRRAIWVRRRILGRELRSRLASFSDIVALRARGSSVRGKHGRISRGWLDLDLVDGRSIRLTDQVQLGTVDDLERLLAEAEPIAEHVKAPVIPSSLAKKAAVTPALWTYFYRSGLQWAAIAGVAAFAYVAALALPILMLAWRIAWPHGHEPFSPAFTMFLAGPAALVCFAAGWRTTRARVTLDAATQTLRREARTFLVPFGGVVARFDQVDHVSLVQPAGDRDGPAWLEARLRDGAALPLGPKSLVRGRDGIRVLLEAEGRTAAGLMGVRFDAAGTDR